MYSQKLFQKHGDLDQFLQNRKMELEQEVRQEDDDYILKVSEEELKDYLVDQYSLQAPMIKEEDITMEKPQDVQIDASKLPKRFTSGGRVRTVKGTRYTVIIPFEGDSELLWYIPSTRRMTSLEGSVNEGKIRLSFDMHGHNEGKLKREYNRSIKFLKDHCEWTKDDIKKFNDSLPNFSQSVIAQRKEKILNDRGIADSLGIPIKKNEDAAKTYSIPPVDKKREIKPPEPSRDSFKPEPVLAEKEYGNILESIEQMAFVMERNPSTFRDLEEEQIRDHFLMMLNAIYEGEATGETFNRGGKTDILIRHEGKNIFIAECKFWRGQKQFNKAIDQLFNYTTWRDTKTAILIFNTRKNFSPILDKIDETARTHDCYQDCTNCRWGDLDPETSYPYLFHNPKDEERQMKLTVMAFDIPSVEDQEKI